MDLCEPQLSVLETGGPTFEMWFTTIVVEFYSWDNPSKYRPRFVLWISPLFIDDVPMTKPPQKFRDVPVSFFPSFHLEPMW